jgi:L-lysine exporter family protein LysE/ArgO
MEGAFPTGFGLGLGLILAIGAQNAFVLRQGLRNEHVLAVCLTCALSDAALISVGVSGFAGLVTLAPWIDPVLRVGGAVFLTVYGARSLWAALRSSDTLVAAEGRGAPLGATLATCLALTWLNPHVYLDTVVLLGTLSTRFPGREVWFGSGAATASLVFFLSLGFGARLLAPLFARPLAWRLLDLVVGLTMGAIALGLVLGN